MTGFVYFIRCHDRVKIGYSADPARRLTKVNADSPYPCELIGFVGTDLFSEKELQERFAAIRAHSEWFWAAPELLTFIADVSVAERTVPSDRFLRADLDGASELKVWRHQNRLSGRDAASLLGMSEPTYNRAENGTRPLCAKRCIAVSNLTGIPTHILRPDVFGDAPPERATA